MQCFQATNNEADTMDVDQVLVPKLRFVNDNIAPVIAYRFCAHALAFIYRSVVSTNVYLSEYNQGEHLVRSTLGKWTHTALHVVHSSMAEFREFLGDFSEDSIFHINHYFFPHQDMFNCAYTAHVNYLDHLSSLYNYFMDQSDDWKTNNKALTSLVDRLLELGDQLSDVFAEAYVAGIENVGLDVNLDVDCMWFDD